MVQYASRFLSWLDETEAPFRVPEEEKDPFLMSVWLHDIGKLLVPPEVLDKPTRLGSGLSDVLHRIEIAKLMLRISLDVDTEERLCELDAAKELILSCNAAGFLDEDKLSQLRNAAKISCLTSDGTSTPLLNDNELEKMTIVRGTLTADERKIVESHVTFTRALLSKMAFHGVYENVPQWAAGHHELLDGSGYPFGLTAPDLDEPSRIVACADVYSALTELRSYRVTSTPEQALETMRDQAREGKLDARLVEDVAELVRTDKYEA